MARKKSKKITALFDRVAFIGIGLIGSSMALAMRRSGLVGSSIACARRAKTRKAALSLDIVDEVTSDCSKAVFGAD